MGEQAWDHLQRRPHKHTPTGHTWQVFKDWVAFLTNSAQRRYWATKHVINDFAWFCYFPLFSPVSFAASTCSCEDEPLPRVARVLLKGTWVNSSRCGQGTNCLPRIHHFLSTATRVCCEIVTSKLVVLKLLADLLLALAAFLLTQNQEHDIIFTVESSEKEPQIPQTTAQLFKLTFSFQINPAPLPPSSLSQDHHR